MSSFRLCSPLAWALAAAVTGVGCGGDSSPDAAAGSLEMTLELVQGGDIDEVAYQIIGSNTLVEGTIDTSAPGSTASVEVYGLPPGDDYVIEMTATSSDGSTTCSGEETFAVDANRVTELMVMLRCKSEPRLGGVRVDGKLNICAELTKAVASPLRTSEGTAVSVAANANDADGDAVAYRWTASGGTIDDSTARETTFVCGDSGSATVTIEVSDDGFEDCIDGWQFDVDCVRSGDTIAFVAGAPVTVSGPSPFAECDADFDPNRSFAANSEVETWVDVDPTDPDHIAVTWQQDRYELGGGARGNVTAVSFDGGESWDVTVLPELALCSDGDYVRVTDPFLAFAADGSLYTASLPFDLGIVGGAVVVHRSTDGGLSWSDPLLVDEAVDPNAHDRETITADPIDPCTAWTVWTIFTETLLNNAGALVVSRTTDCGESWTPPVVLSETSPRKIAGQLVVLPDGTMRTFAIGGREIVMHVSNDRGDTWSEAMQVTPVRLGQPVAIGASARIRSGVFDVAVDATTGALYLVWEELSEPILPLQIAFKASFDGGATWSDTIRVDQTPPGSTSLLDQAFLPSVAVSDDGTIGVTYYNFQNADVTSSESLTDHWFVYCDPSERDCTTEASWANTAVRLTATSFDYLEAPRVTGQRLLFLGDYVGLAAGGSDFFSFFSTTTDEDPANGVFVPIRRVETAPAFAAVAP